MNIFYDFEKDIHLTRLTELLTISNDLNQTVITSNTRYKVSV